MKLKFPLYPCNAQKQMNTGCEFKKKKVKIVYKTSKITELFFTKKEKRKEKRNNRTFIIQTY